MVRQGDMPITCEASFVTSVLVVCLLENEAAASALFNRQGSDSADAFYPLGLHTGGADIG